MTSKQGNSREGFGKQRCANIEDWHSVFPERVTNRSRAVVAVFFLGNLANEPGMLIRRFG